MNEVDRWEEALVEADALLDTDWVICSGEPGWMHRYGDWTNRRQFPLDVWYLRRAMTVGRGWAVQTRKA